MPTFNINTVDLARINKLKEKLNAKSNNDAVRALLGLEYNKKGPADLAVKQTVIPIDTEVHGVLKSAAEADGRTMHNLFVKLMDERDDQI